MFPRVILNGTLIKKSQQKKITSPENYKERLFELDTKELKYSECRSGRKLVLKGSIQLCKIKCVEIVNTDLPIPCAYKYPFQVFYDNYYLYIFAPDNDCRQQWVKALKEETQFNENFVTKYHPDMWMEGKWRCCQQTERLAVGCAEYNPVTSVYEKSLPSVPNPRRKHSKTRVVAAIQDFTPVEKGELQIQKEQKYILLDDSDIDHWLVQDSEGNAGLVPSTYVAGQFENNFDRFEWYDDDITSEEATHLLSKEGKEGAFMVRRSSRPGQYTVSVYSCALVPSPEKKTNVRHYLIRQKTESEAPFYVAEKKSFSTIPELVHYHQHDCAGMVTRLRHPVSRPISSYRRPSIAQTDNFEDRWQMDPLELILDGKLGNGQFGLVMGGKWRDKKVAVKMINDGAMSEAEFKEEAKVMMKLSHCKLVQLYGVCTQRSPMCMVFEFMEQGALLDYLRARKGDFSQDTLLGMCLDVCEGMNYLECSNYLHRDLAARNCLVSQSNLVKVADFGMARFVLDNDYTSSQGSKFPIRWSAPEVIRYGKYTSKSDVWAFGVLMWEVYSEGLLPYDKLKNMDVVNSVNRGQRLSKPNLAPEDVHVLMKWCWKENPEDRPTFGQLLHQLGCLQIV